MYTQCCLLGRCVFDSLQLWVCRDPVIEIITRSSFHNLFNVLLKVTVTGALTNAAEPCLENSSFSSSSINFMLDRIAWCQISHALHIIPLWSHPTSWELLFFIKKIKSRNQPFLKLVLQKFFCNRFHLFLISFLNRQARKQTLYSHRLLVQVMAHKSVQALWSWDRGKRTLYIYNKSLWPLKCSRHYC